MSDIKRTQHFTENYRDILYNIDFHPAEAVDPFAGAKDLVAYSPGTKWELYDIDPKSPDVAMRDSLLDPIDYTGKSVITNPPYLARNKTKDFREIYERYRTDDLYKAAILSITGCRNGILVIPLNFFTDEGSRAARERFLSIYKVSYVNYFTRQMFESTTYNVCSFYFEKGETSDVEFYDFQKKKSVNVRLDRKYGYRAGGEFYEKFRGVKPVFSRLLKGETPSTRIFVSCLDKRHAAIYAAVSNIYYGSASDRIFATLKCSESISPEKQEELCGRFNRFLKEERAKYGNLILTNYRDFGRKRISFDDVYRIMTMLYREMQA